MRKMYDMSLQDVCLPQEKRERNIFGLFCVLIPTIMLAYLAVMTIIKANTYLDAERVERLYAFDLALLVPEPQEFQRFALYCILICVFGLGFTLLYRRYMSRIPYLFVIKANPVLFGLAALVFFFTLYVVGTFDEGYYLPYMSFYSHLFLAVALFALAIVLLLAYRSLVERFPKLRRAVFLFDAVVTGLVFYFSLLLHYYNLEVSPFAVHFSVVFNPIFELSIGHTPGVDFDPLYGLHGYFFYWLQSIIWGNIHYRDTIMLMAGLVFVGNMALYIFLVKMFRQRFVAAITLAAIIYFTQLFFASFYAEISGPRFAYFPVRTIVPAITLCLIAFMHTARNKRAKTILFAFAALVATGGIFWNPETGLVVVLALAGYMVYCTLCEHRITDKDFWKKATVSFAAIVAAFSANLLTLQFITINRTGVRGGGYPLSRLFWAISTFSGDGFLMIPLPDKHPYILVLGVYSAVVILSLYSLFIVKSKPNKEAYDNALGFAVAVMGFGLFTYFLGQSHPDVFSCPVWPAFIALAFVALKLSGYFKLRFAEWREGGYGWGDVPGLVQGTIVGAASLVLVFFLFAIGLSLYTVSNTDAMYRYNAARTTVSVPSRETLATIDNYRTDNLFVIDAYSMFYLSELNLKNDYRGQALNDLFLKQDYFDIISQLETYSGRVIVSNYPYNLVTRFETFTNADGETFAEKLKKVLAERYVLIAEEGGLYVYDYYK